MRIVGNKRIQAVIFDLDDTLIDWSGQMQDWDEFTRPMADGLHTYLLERGHAVPNADEFFKLWREQVHFVWEDARKDWMGATFDRALQLTLNGCQIDADNIDLEELAKAYTWGPMPGIEVYDDTHDVLDELRRRQYKIGLVTNSFLPMWMRDVELRHYDLIDYFDARLTCGDVGYMKPHPAIYEHILEILGVEPQRAVFVGDSPTYDIAGANEAGLFSVLIDPPHLNRELNGIVPDHTINTLSELLDYLDELEAEPQRSTP